MTQQQKYIHYMLNIRGRQCPLVVLRDLPLAERERQLREQIGVYKHGKYDIIGFDHEAGAEGIRVVPRGDCCCCILS